MHRTWKYALLPLTLAAALLACPGAEDEEKSTLEVTVAQAQLNGEGQGTTVYVTALDEKGQAGTGTVTLTVKVGDLSAAGGLEARLELQDGKASTSYTCTSKPDLLCKGSVRIQAEWAGVKDSVTVLFPTPDGGSSGDGGTPTDGGTDAGTPRDGGTDAGP